ncbi:MAG: CheR family methyltransferase [Ilumatobacteraceae bacterium]
MTDISQNDFLHVKKLVMERAAIVWRRARNTSSPLGSTPWREIGFPSHVELIARLRSHPDPKLVQQVVEAMTTNETSFYRDAKPFEALRTHILPELIAKRQQAKTLTVWCGACSTGQEPYTIWMVMKDHFPELAHWRVKIIGTDISTDVLAKAKSGKYTQLEVNRGIPTPILVKHFEREGPFWKIHQDAHRIVEFRELNLIGQWPSMPRPDIVFLRNVMIYFDIATRKQILGRIAQLMASRRLLVPRRRRDHAQHRSVVPASRTRPLGMFPARHPAVARHKEGGLVDPTSEDINTLTVQVWESVLGLPLEQDAPDPDVKDLQVTSCVHITGGWEGSVLVRCTRELAHTITGSMFDMDPSEATTDEIADAIGEIANMIGGNVKSLVPGPSQLSLPWVADGGELTFLDSEPCAFSNFVASSQPLLISVLRRAPGSPIPNLGAS